MRLGAANENALLLPFQKRQEMRKCTHVCTTSVGGPGTGEAGEQKRVRENRMQRLCITPASRWQSEGRSAFNEAIWELVAATMNPANIAHLGQWQVERAT